MSCESKGLVLAENNEFSRLETSSPPVDLG